MNANLNFIRFRQSKFHSFAVAALVVLALSDTMSVKASSSPPAAATPPPTAVAPQVRYELEAGQVREGVNGTSVSVTARFYNDSDKELTIPVWGRAEIADVFRFEIMGPDGKALVPPQQGRLTAPIPAQVTRDLVTTRGRVADQ